MTTIDLSFRTALAVRNLLCAGAESHGCTKNRFLTAEAVRYALGLVIAPSEADATSAPYFAKTPVA
jgi:hypothetical protein